MAKDNLVIVESPAKAKTIEKFLGNDYKVMSSYGHIRDLKKKTFSIDTEDFTPQYEIPADKARLVEELKKQAQKAKTVWLLGVKGKWALVREATADYDGMFGFVYIGD